MAPVGDEYSSISDELFEELWNDGDTIEVPIHVAAFWKYNVRVIEYEYVTRSEFFGDSDGNFTSTATTTLKEGAALLYTNSVGIDYLGLYVLFPSLLSAHSFEPQMFPNFTWFQFFNHRGKWYINTPFFDLDYGTTSNILTADLSKISLISGTVGSANYETYTYTCLETFY